MTDSDQKTGPGGAMQVSEEEVEAFLERTGSGMEGALADSAEAASAPDGAGPTSPGPGAAPPPLPRRRRLARIKPVHIAGFLALCAVLGLGIGLLWNLAFAPETEQASPAAAGTKPDAVQEPPAAVEIRLGEMVVTSDDEEGEGNGSGAKAGESEPQ